MRRPHVPGPHPHLEGRDPNHDGAIAADIVMHDKPVGRGYVKLLPTADHPWPHEPATEDEIRCHEFHYSSIENLPPDTRYAYRVSRGHGIDGSATASCTRTCSLRTAIFGPRRRTTGAARFVAFIRQCMAGRGVAASASQPRAA